MRRNTTDWRTKVVKQCNSKCIITGSQIYEVHHTYCVNQIIADVLYELNYEYKIFSEYSDEELSNILSLFAEKQDSVIGVYIHPDIHKLYHKLYGYKNYKEQFDFFLENYKQGKYNNLINDI